MVWTGEKTGNRLLRARLGIWLTGAKTRTEIVNRSGKIIFSDIVYWDQAVTFSVGASNRVRRN